MIVPSFAKINLGLRVLGKRADGFHEIETIFQTISVKDSLSFEPVGPDIEFTTDSENCPNDPTNLVVRAAQLLKDFSHTSAGCKIKLHKNIPSGAGLGGGSSNAAVTLTTLDQLWNIDLGEQQLLQLAAQLGSDVPFFIHGGSALGTGRGEILQPIDVKDTYWGVLICPEIHISTPWAYKELNFPLTKSLKNSKFSVFTSQHVQKMDWQTLLPNDFESVVFKSHPELETIFAKLNKTEAFYSRMSGSGSSIFALYDNPESAEKIYQSFTRQYDTVFLFQPV